MRKNSKQEQAAKLANYHGFNATAHFIQDLTLMHAVEVTALGGAQQLNDANTKVLVGVSDFNGLTIPQDAKGLIDAIAIQYASVPVATIGFGASPAGQVYSPVKADVPAWFLNSEIIVSSSNIEHIRMRVSETMLLDKAQAVPSDYAKELLKSIKVTPGQDLTISLSSPKDAVLDNTKKHFVRVDLYGAKFGNRKGV